MSVASWHRSDHSLNIVHFTFISMFSVIPGRVNPDLSGNFPQLNAIGLFLFRSKFQTADVIARNLIRICNKLTVNSSELSELFNIYQLFTTENSLPADLTRDEGILPNKSLLTKLTWFPCISTCCQSLLFDVYGDSVVDAETPTWTWWANCAGSMPKVSKPCIKVTCPDDFF